MKQHGNSILQRILQYKGLLLAAVLMVAVLGSCKDDDDDSTPEAKNIVALAQANSNLSSLVTALTKYPDLVSTLSGSGKYTVFAPTNTAFATLLTATGQSSLDDLPEDVLRDVLEYHVVSGAVKSTELKTGAVETVGGEDIAVTTTGGVKLNGTTNVTTADVEASNGVVHVIDAVLVPPSIVPVVGTIVAPAFFNKNFTTLVAAVKQAGLVETLINKSANYTLFAPTNAAFTAAGITALPPNTTEGNATLSGILKYHVLASKVTAANIAAGSSSAATLNGKIYLSKGASGVFINGATKVTTADVQASNGVVHVIDRALVPPSKTIAQIVSDAANAASGKQFTKLLQALARTDGEDDDLLAAASGEGNLTVFAPTDAAFEALGVDLATVDLAALTKILKHHIVAARVFSSDLSSGSVATLYKSVTIDLPNLTVTGAKTGEAPAKLQATMLNIHATNGVIHVIDKVLIPE